jgi:dihydrofolate reductase
VPEGVILVNTLEDAIKASISDPQPFIIGGGEIYAQAILIADKIELTRVHDSFEADTFFPKIDPTVWKETSNTFYNKDEKNEIDYSFVTYKRK